MEYLIERKKLSENIHVLTLKQKWEGNLLLLEGINDILLIDSGYRSTKEELKRYLNQEYKKAVKIIINTHHHGDHVGGNSILSAEHGELYIHKNAEINCPGGIKINKVDADTTTFFDDFEISLYPRGGGHSITDMIIGVDKNHILHLGDLLLSESFPLIGNKKQNDVKKLQKDLNFALDLCDDDTIIVPGHGKILNKAELIQYITMVEQTKQIVAKEIMNGVELKSIKCNNILREFECWSGNISFITKETWINDIFWSYYIENNQSV